MKFTFRVLVFVFFISCISFAQNDKDFPALDTNDVSGGRISRADYFDGNALWGHIDGGADLYLEYGFDKLLFQEIQLNGVTFRVEYYRMKDAEAAFGIYSVSRFKCSITDTLSSFVCINPYQVQSALGRFYISVVNDKGNKEAETLTVNLFAKILEKNKDKIFELPELFRKKEIPGFNSAAKLIKGRLGLQNGFPNWEEMLGDFSGYRLFVLPIQNGSSFANIAQIKFASENDLKSFLTKNNVAFEPNKTDYQVTEKSVTKKIRVIGSDEIIFCESDNVDLLSKIIE